MQTVLVIEPNIQLRKALSDRCSRVGLRAVLVENVFVGVDVVGTATTPFDFVVFPAGRRALALRRLCLLAREKRLETEFVTYLCGEATESHVRAALQGVELAVISPKSVEDIVTYVQRSLALYIAEDDEEDGDSATEARDLAALGSMRPTSAADTGPVLFPDAVDEDADTEIHDVAGTSNPSFVMATSQNVVEEGLIGQDRSTTNLLVELTLQGFTGRLECAGEVLFMFAGDPVWASHPDGVEGLLEELTASEHLPRTESTVRRRRSYLPA